MRYALVLAALAATSAGAQAPKAACPSPAVPVIDSAGLMRDVGRLAADSMKGRRVGTPENAKARAFIGARFDDLKLGTVGKERFAPFTTTGRRGNAIQGSNVLGVIRGTRFPDEYIVVSSHFDHIGFAGDPGAQCRAIEGDAICNGADDNASGTAAVMALAKYFSEHRPAHSIIFASFDAEESGDVGSRAWVDSMPLAVDHVLIDVNLDMVGRNDKNQLFATGTAKYPHLLPLINTEIGCAPAPLVLIAGHDGEAGREDWTSQSDQAAFHRKGIPFIYFGEEDHPDYHKAGDQVERLMPAFYVSATRLVANFIQRFDANPVVKPK